MRLEIYVSNIRNPAIQKHAQARWMICAYQGDKVQDQRKGSVTLSNATTKKAALVALRDALKRFNKAAVIKIYVQDDFVRNMLRAKMPERWAANNWRLLRYNREIHHLELWQEISCLLKIHAVSYAGADETAGNIKIKELEELMKNVRN